MKLPALVRFSKQDVYMSLTILGCTVNCRFRFADCPLIHCEKAILTNVYVDINLLCLPLHRGHFHVYKHYFQTAASLNPINYNWQINFVWNFFGKAEQKYI